MTIGQRIKQARKASQKSLRALAEEVGVSAMAISKYERNEVVPSSSVVIRLSHSMNVPVDYFFRPAQEQIEVQAFRKHASLGKKDQEAIQARIQEWVERYFEIEDLLFVNSPHFELPRFPVNSFEDVEAAAQELRQAWDLGADGIDNLIELLEDRGIKVGQVDGFEDFDACTFLVKGEPVMVTRSNIPGDRQRFNLAHELGHLVLDVPEGLDQEKAAYRFAGAFLVPAETARFELGEKRTGLEISELYMLKRKYGLSMQAWIYRARDLGIISENTFQVLCKRFRRYGWRRQEPGANFAPPNSLQVAFLAFPFRHPASPATLLRPPRAKAR